MKRAGFTMIELIFVIVILGILAAVAIPRLAATRDDAKVSKLATNVATAQSEIGSYIIATGTVAFTESVYREASNVVATGLDTGDIDVATDTVSFLDEVDGTNTCITLQVDDTNVSDVQIRVAHGTGTSAICVGVQQIVQESNSTMAGNRVVY